MRKMLSPYTFEELTHNDLQSNTYIYYFNMYLTVADPGGGGRTRRAPYLTVVDLWHTLTKSTPPVRSNTESATVYTKLIILVEKVGYCLAKLSNICNTFIYVVYLNKNMYTSLIAFDW